MHNLALVVLNYNSYEDTVKCTDQLLSFHEDFHIIVVDNRSPDHSGKRLREYYRDEPAVDVIRTDGNRGYSAGNNFGMKYAVKTYGVDTVGVLNPDVLIPKAEVLTVMLKKLYQDPSYAIIGGAMLDRDGRFNMAGACWELPDGLTFALSHCVLLPSHGKSPSLKMVGEQLAQADCVAGCFFLAKVSHMKKLGWLDEALFMYKEEILLGLRCRQIGYKEVVALDQFYYHNHHRPKRDVPFMKKVMTMSSGYRSAKYICKKYYAANVLPVLWCVEMINRGYLAGCWVYHRILRRAS